jgi:hypothetical protein
MEGKETAMSVLNGINIDSFADRIFSPDPLACFLHESVYGGQGGSADDETLRKLMLAVLQDGIACFQGYLFKLSRRNEALSREAEEWINSKDDGIFTFNNVCETLGLDPDIVRKGLQRWKAKQMGIPSKERKRILLRKGKCAGKTRKEA